jgi:hypothetical protein
MRGRARAHKDASGQACSSREEGGRLMDIFTVALHYSVSVVYSGTVVCGFGGSVENRCGNLQHFYF